MKRKLNFLFAAIAMTGLLVSCGDNNAANDDDTAYLVLDSTWDASDNAFMADYNTVMTENQRIESEMQAMNASSSDSAAAARYAAAQQRLAANRQALQDMDAKRTQARAARDAARTAKNRAAYDSARMSVDYDTWKSDLNRIRTEQGEMQGMIKIGSKSVGGVDVNTKDTSKPLLRVEPGKEDNKPLIEKNKNP